MNFPLRPTKAQEPPPQTLEDKLTWLCRYGKPRLHYMGDSWYATIEMNTTAQGTSFKIDSDFYKGSPTTAVEQVIERMVKALSDLGATP